MVQSEITTRIAFAPGGEIDLDVDIAGKSGAIAKNLKTVPRLGAITRAAARLRHIRNPSALAQFVSGAKAFVALPEPISKAPNSR